MGNKTAAGPGSACLGAPGAQPPGAASSGLAPASGPTPGPAVEKKTASEQEPVERDAGEQAPGSASAHARQRQAGGAEGAGAASEPSQAAGGAGAASEPSQAGAASAPSQAGGDAGAASASSQAGAASAPSQAGGDAGAASASSQAGAASAPSQAAGGASKPGSPSPSLDPEVESILAAETAPSRKQGALKGRAAERAAVVVLYVLLAAAFLGSFAMGKYALSLHDTLQVIAHLLFGAPATYAPAAETVFLQVRLPRIVTCVFAGAALAVSGAVYQGIFKNPMVSPDLLGASSGSAFGACVGILLGFAYSEIQLVAFVLGLAAVALTVAVSQAVTRNQGTSTVTMILTGMVVTALFNAGVGICKLLADADTQLGEITFWLMGSMTHVGFSDIPRLVVPIAIGCVPLVLLRYRLNVLSFGDEEARTLGLNVPLLRAVFIVCSTLVTSATVACCGMVGWIGLVIPHLLRLVLGPDYRLLVPASLAGGGLFLLLVDNITRIFFQVEVSIGILTALVGAPFFLVLLVKGRRGWE